jgi:hypothetical protein
MAISVSPVRFFTCVFGCLHNQSGFVKLSSGQLARCPEFLLERKLRVSLRRKEAKFATKKKKKKKKKKKENHAPTISKLFK